MKGVEVTFPVISDLTMEVSKAFGMLQPAASTTQAVRTVFIIDPETTVRAILYYPLSNGRNMDEVTAPDCMQHSESTRSPRGQCGQGDDVIVRRPARAEAQAARRGACSDTKVLDWFLTSRNAHGQK